MRFTKATGSGNDFIILDNRQGAVSDPSALAASLCRRGLSVGADGLLLLEGGPPGRFRFRIFNSDGSEARMCGNGLRCFFRYLVDRGLLGEGIRGEVETASGTRWGEVRGNRVTVGLGAPRETVPSLVIGLSGGELEGGFTNTGVPHLVVEVADLESVPVAETGREARYHERFAPDGANVNFVRVRDGVLEIRTYEVGVEAETLSCGTGSAASAHIMRLRGRLSLPARVRAASGELLEIGEEGGGLTLSAAASLVYEGRLREDPGPA